MTPEQELKYGIRGEQLYNRQSGELIPEDEPLFIVRAKDINAVKLLSYYVNVCKEKDHCIAVMQRMADFMKYAEDHPSLMREPTTNLPKVGKQPVSEEEEDDGLDHRGEEEARVSEASRAAIEKFNFPDEFPDTPV